MKMVKNKSRKTRKNYGHEDVTRYFLSEIQGHDDDEVEEYIESDDIRIFEGTTKEYAQELADSVGGPMVTFTNPEYYFDYASFGRDLKMDDALTSHLHDDLNEAEERRDAAQSDLEDAQTELADAEDDDEREDAEDAIETAEAEIEEAQEEMDEIQGNIDYYDNLSDQAYAEEYESQIGNLSEILSESQMESYFDYDAVARDMELGGDVIEFEYDGKTYVAEAHY